MAAFRNDLSRQLFSGNVKKVYLDFDKVYENTPAVEAYRLGKYLKEHAPFVGLGNLHPIMKQLRLIKKPCEIEAMKKAETITKAGIEAMECFHQDFRLSFHQERTTLKFITMIIADRHRMEI